MAYYLGKRGSELTVFHSIKVPTRESHGHLYAGVIGPFQSRIGAGYFARYARTNPCIRTAGDVERLARADPRMDQGLVEETLSAEDLAIAQACAAQDQWEESPT
jgi:hypothetical protein